MPQLNKHAVSGSIDSFIYLKTTEKGTNKLIRRVDITNSDKKEVIRYKKYIRKIFPQYFVFAELSNYKLESIFKL